MNQVKFAAGVLAVVWVCGASLLLWNSYSSDYRSFLHELAPDLSTLHTLPIKEQLTLVHYLDSECSCNRFAVPHVEQLQADYPELRHIVLDASRREGPYRTELGQWAISSPSLSIVAPDGTVIYHGPYTSGLTCGAGEDFVATALDEWRNKNQTGFMNILGFGCFCPWHEGTDNDTQNEKKDA